MSSRLCFLTFYLIKLSNLFKLWLEYIVFVWRFQKEQKKETNIVSMAIIISGNDRLQV